MAHGHRCTPICSNVQQCAAMCINLWQCAAMSSNVLQCGFVPAGRKIRSLKAENESNGSTERGTFLRPDQTDFSQTHFQCSRKACKLTVFEDWRFSLSQTQMRGAISSVFFFHFADNLIFSHIGVLLQIFPKKRGELTTNAVLKKGPNVA